MKTLALTTRPLQIRSPRLLVCLLSIVVFSPGIQAEGVSNDESIPFETGLREAEKHSAKSTMDIGSPRYERARALYFDKCVGCHGANREGRAGSVLFGSLMQRVGDDALKHVLHFGTPDGMPNWGSSEQLSEDDVEQLSQFLQLAAPEAPAYAAKQVEASWQEWSVVDQPTAQGLTKWLPKNLFVSLLHDVGRVLLIDGESKAVLFSIATGVAPTAIELSSDNRYLYVLHRDGRVVSIDLRLAVPQVVASVRVGHEARAIALGGSPRKPWLLVGVQAPSQLVRLEPDTLRPLQTIALPINAKLPLGMGGRVEQIHSTGRRGLDALVATGIPGDLYVLRRAHSATSELQKEASLAAPELRTGSSDVSGRYVLFPTNTERVAVFDSFEKRLLPMALAPGLKAGSAGTSFLDPDYGPVWASSSLFSSKLIIVGTDPKRNAEYAWRTVRTLETADEGSMFVASHPGSRHLWVDSPASSSTEAAASVTVFDRDRLDEPGKVIALYELVDLAGFPGRVLHPQFNAAGDEIWLTIWNRSDRRSAIVVINDKTLAIKTVIEDSRLITPIRTFSVASLLSRRRRN